MTSPEFVFISAVVSVNGLSTKIIPPACEPTPLTSPSIFCAASHNSGYLFISVTNSCTGGLSSSP